ncbi:MAG TPA: S8 family serine peptidase [Candidatus Bipolaricaulota bacterium]
MTHTVLARSGLLLSIILLFGFSTLSYPHQEPSRLQGVLSQLAQAASQGQSLEPLARSRGVAVTQGRVQVIVEAQSASAIPAIRLELASRGALDVSSYQLWVQAKVPLDQLINLSNARGVRYVRVPYVAKPASVISEGVSLIGALEYQRLGLQGNGVKIAIIDLGFEGLAEAFANGELPDNIEQYDLTNTGMGGIAHGMAVTEIVHDVAPGATLLLLKVANEVQLGQAVEEALRRGARIINHSVVWFNTEYGDGRGGVSQVAAQAVARGVVWVNAAGNTAVQHWKGPYRDRDDDSWVEFDQFGSESLPLQADSGEFIEVFMNWDAWPQTAYDYDVFITYDANRNGLADVGEPFVTSSDAQRGLDPPLEDASMFAPFAGQYLITVWYKGTTLPPPLEIFTGAQTLRTPVHQGSVLAPATAAGVLAVGAVNRVDWASGKIRSFSAQGPTSDGRIKPDVVAPDDVSNFTASRFPLQFGVDGRFVGTSASAPHVSGAIALLFEETPGMTASQAFQKITRNALPLPPATPNNVNGFGKVHLTLTPDEGLAVQLSDLAVSSSVVEAGSTVTISVRVHNPNQNETSASIPMLIDGRTVAVREVTLEPGSSQVITFQWQFENLGTYSVTVEALSPLSLRVVEALEVASVIIYPQGNHGLRVEVQGQGIEKVQVAIYDLAGQRVILAESDVLFHVIPLYTASGIPLANGVYLYQVTVFGATNLENHEIKKLLVLF